MNPKEFRAMAERMPTAELEDFAMQIREIINERKENKRKELFKKLEEVFEEIDAMGWEVVDNEEYYHAISLNYLTIE